jgi:tRNA U34 5-carboxymethylaminomethyl modifying GTPase MnmE/TrmE
MTDLPEMDRQGPHIPGLLVVDAPTLKAEVLALLLEPLGVDATLGLASLELLTTKAASLAQARGCADTPPSGTTLRGVSQAVAECAEARQLTQLAADQGRNLTPTEAAAALELTQLEGIQTHLQSLVGVTVDALRSDLAAVATAERFLPRVLDPCRRALKNWPKEMRYSILEIDIDRAMTDLTRARSSGRRALRARELVLGNSVPTAGDLDNRDLAMRLRTVLAFAAARTTYTEVLAAQPEWWRWLGPDTRFKFRADRRDALLWVIETRDTGAVPASTLELLADQTARSVISGALASRTPGKATPAVLPPTSSAERLRSGLTTVGTKAELDDLRAIESWYTKGTESFDKVAAAVDARLTDPALAEALQRLADEAPHPFGAPDTSRSSYREIQSALRAEVLEQVQRATYSVHAIENEYLVATIGRIGAYEQELRDSVRAIPAARGKLIVAIAGRTKSGKSTLRKALTRDPDRTGIGRGAHRTTRETAAFELDSVTYLDTPGVAAKDDDFDATRARQAYDIADAIIWNYADTLRDEEAAELRRLFRSGKPLLAVVNVKERVDTRQRLELFAQHPERVFKSTPGHFARIEQVAHLAGAKPPIRLAVHSGAAHEALSMDDALRASAFRASRLPELERKLAELLAERAVPLRAVRLAEGVRSPLATYHRRATEELPQIDLALQELEAAAPDLQAEVLAAIRAAGQHALDRLEAKRQDATRQLLALIPRLGGADHERRWNGFINDVALESLVSELQTELEEEFHKRQQVLRTRASTTDRQHEQRLRVYRRPNARIWRRIAAAAQGAATALLSTLTARGIVKKLVTSAPGGPAAPWLTVVGYVADGVASAAKAVSKDVERTRQELSAWTSEAASSAEAHVDTMFANVGARVRRLVDDIAIQVSEQFDAQTADIARTRDRYTRLSELQSEVQSALDAIDLTLARRLVSLAGGDADAIRSARRVPGVELRVWTNGSAVEGVRACLQDKFVDVLTERIEIRPDSGNLVAVTGGPRNKRRGRQ